MATLEEDPKKNPASYFGPFLDRQETADLIGKYVDSHLVFIFQGVPPKYLEMTLGNHNVLAVERAYAEDSKIVFKYWHPGTGSTVPSLVKKVGEKVYGYVAFLSQQGLERFDLNMGTELAGGEHWHKRTRTVVVLPERPQPNRVRAWSYRATKPSWAERKKRRYVPKAYKQAMADMYNETGWKQDDGSMMTVKDVDRAIAEGTPVKPIRASTMRKQQARRNPFTSDDLPLDTRQKVVSVAQQYVDAYCDSLLRTGRPPAPVLVTFYRDAGPAMEVLPLVREMDTLIGERIGEGRLKAGVVGMLGMHLRLTAPPPNASGFISAILDIPPDMDQYVAFRPFDLHANWEDDEGSVTFSEGGFGLISFSEMEAMEAEAKAEAKPPRGSGGYKNPGYPRRRRLR